MTIPPRSLPWIYGLLLVAAVVGTRARWLDHDLWNLDEGSTFTMAQQVLEGDVLYRDAADNRSPLVPYLKALIFAIGGDWNSTAVHGFIAIALGLVALAIGWIGCRLDRPLTGWAAALLFVFLQILYVDPGDSMSANTEWFVIIFSTAAFALFVYFRNTLRFGRGVLVGLLFGFSALCKQPGLLDAIVVLVLLALMALTTNQDRRAITRMAGGLIVGAAIPFTVAWGYFAYHHALEDFYYYAFTFNTAVYLPEVPFWERMMCVRTPFILAWRNVPIIGGMAVLGAFGLLFHAFRCTFARKNTPFPLLPWLILGWTTAGLITTSLSGREFSHYSQQVIPGISLAAGWLISRIASMRPARFPWCGRLAAIAVSLAIMLSALFQYRSVFTYLDNSSQPDRRLADSIMKYSGASERIFVWGYFPEHYFRAKRLPATRYVYANYITGMVAWSNLDAWQDVEYAVTPGGWDKFYRDFEDTPPALIIDTRSARGYAKFPLGAREPLWSEIKRHYVQVASDTEEGSQSRLFRRLQPRHEEKFISHPGTYSPKASINGILALQEFSVPQIQFTAPSGYDLIELVSSGKVIATLDHPIDEPVAVRFFASAEPMSSDKVWVRASGPAGEIHSKLFDFDEFVMTNHAKVAPQFPLVIGEHSIFPSVVNTNHDSVPRDRARQQSWSLVAPARLVYECPTQLKKIRFRHGLHKQMHFQSDGYDIVVRWLPDAGAPYTLWRERFTPYKEGKHQLPQSQDVDLPPREPGKLEIRFMSGAKSSPDYDHLFFGQLEGVATSPVISFGDQLVLSDALETDKFIAHHPGTWVLHAPTEVSWSRPPNLMQLNFNFGIDPGAYDATRTGQTDGVQFRVLLHGEDGSEHTLFDRTLRPFEVPEDRGLQPGSAFLPAEPQGTLSFAIDVGEHGNGAWDWAWAGHFVGVAPGPAIILNPQRKLMVRSTSGFNRGWADPVEEDHWGAQTPQELIYPKPADLTAVTFTYGMFDEAIRDEAGSRLSDGVEVVVFFESEGKPPHELYRRSLDPYNTPSDLGRQQATVALPAAKKGTLKFRMEPGPQNNNAYDWAYWGPFEGETLADKP